SQLLVAATTAPGVQVVPAAIVNHAAPVVMVTLVIVRLPLAALLLTCAVRVVFAGGAVPKAKGTCVTVTAVAVPVKLTFWTWNGSVSGLVKRTARLAILLTGVSDVG